jgi:raffinose/stachyose/melibiose transport system permease protein
MIRRAIREGNLWAYLFVLPALVFYGLFTIKSVFGSLILSLTDWNGVSPVKRFVGLKNYADILRDPIAGIAVRNNIVWVAMSLVLSIGTALFLAVLISNVIRGQTFFRVTLFLPNVLSVAATGLIWGRIYDPFIGVSNLLLKAIGLGHIARGWLGDPNWALPAINFANSWRAS